MGRFLRGNPTRTDAPPSARPWSGGRWGRGRNVQLARTISSPPRRVVVVTVAALERIRASRLGGSTRLVNFTLRARVGARSAITPRFVHQNSECVARDAQALRRPPRK